MTCADWIVRNARKEDFPRLIELLKVTDLFWETGDTEEVFEKKLAFDPNSILVLECMDKIIGMVTTVYDPWASFIWHVAIDPAYQKRGLGHMLAEEAEKRLKARGTTSVNGYVLPTNRNSLSFLRVRGYTECVTVVAMEKVLKN